MLNFLLPLMKNPLTRIIADKTVSAINHSIEKKKVIRAKEREAEANVSIEQIRSSKGSIKEEVRSELIFIIPKLLICQGLNNFPSLVRLLASSQSKPISNKF